MLVKLGGGGLPKEFGLRNDCYHTIDADGVRNRWFHEAGSCNNPGLHSVS